jgi:hypothetical protein
MVLRRFCKATMPQYFFHICDDLGTVPDDEGTYFEDDEAAKVEGESSARELLVHNIRSRKPLANRRIEVTTNTGEVIATYRLCELFD